MWFRRAPIIDPAQTVVLLTGAGNGIGRATSRALAQRGFRMGLVDRDEAGLRSVAGEIASQNGPVHAIPADVRDSDQTKAAVAAIEQALGPIEIVVACAGFGRISSILDLDLEGFRQMLEVNLLGVARTIEAVLPGMFARKRGHIVGISSVAGYRGMPWMPGYSASKAGLTTYLEALRPALKRRGVRVTTVYPGFVRTGMTIDTPFARPVKMLEVEEAADYLVHAVLRRPRDYTFPFSARLGMGLLRRLPNRLFDYCMDQAGPRALTSEF